MEKPLYFAYGSNINLDQMRDPPRQPAWIPFARSRAFHVSGAQKRSIFGRKH